MQQADEQTDHLILLLENLLFLLPDHFHDLKIHATRLVILKQKIMLIEHHDQHREVPDPLNVAILLEMMRTMILTKIRVAVIFLATRHITHHMMRKIADLETLLIPLAMIHARLILVLKIILEILHDLIHAVVIHQDLLAIIEKIHRKLHRMVLHAVSHVMILQETILLRAHIQNRVQKIVATQDDKVL